MGRLYGRERYNPLLIIGQILLLQLIFYVVFSLVSYSSCFLSNTKWSPDLLLDVTHMTVFSPAGWSSIAGLFAGALAAATALPPIVERAKKAVDFAFTVFFFHGCMCTFWGQSMPMNSTWWLTISVAFIFAAALGEHLCVRREMTDISVEDVFKSRAVRRVRAAEAVVGGGGGNVKTSGTSANLFTIPSIIVVDDNGVGSSAVTTGAAAAPTLSLAGSIIDNADTARSISSVNIKSSAPETPSSVSDWLRGSFGKQGLSRSNSFSSGSESIARGPFGAIIYGTTPSKHARGVPAAVAASFDELATAAVGATTGLTRRATAAATGDGSFANLRGESVGPGGRNNTSDRTSDTAAAIAAPIETEGAPFLTPRGKTKPPRGFAGGAWAAIAPIFEAFGVGLQPLIVAESGVLAVLPKGNRT